MSLNLTTRKKWALVMTLPSLGGLEINVLRLAQYRIQNQQPTLLVLAKGSASERWATRENLPHTTVNRPNKYFSLGVAFQLNKIIKAHFIEHVFVSSTQDIDLLFWTSCFFSKSLQVTYYQQMQLGVNKKDFYHNLKHNFLSHWISPLQWLKDEVSAKTNIAPCKISVLPLCLDTVSFVERLKKFLPNEIREKYHIPPNHYAMGIIGRIDPGKGQLEALKAFDQIKNEIPNWIFFIIGSPTLNDSAAKAYENSIIEHIKSTDQSQRVRYIPHLHDPCEIYSILKILIVASHKETFGMVTVEGLLSGLVIVGSNQGATPDLLEHGKLGLLYDPKTPDDLSKKLITATKNMTTISKNVEDAKNRLINDYSIERLSLYLQSLSTKDCSH